MAIAHIATVNFQEDMTDWYEAQVDKGKVWAFVTDPTSDDPECWMLNEEDLMTTDEMLKQAALDIRDDGFCRIYLDMIICDQEYQEKFKKIESVFGKPEIASIGWGFARVWEKNKVGRPVTGEAKVSRTIRLPKDVDAWVSRKAAEEGCDRTQIIVDILTESKTLDA